MTEALVKVMPIFAGFAVAMAVKRLGWLRPEHGSLMLKVSLYVTIPALIVVSVSHVGFVKELMIFPLLSGIVLAVTFTAMQLFYRRLHLSRQTEGTFRVAPLTINSGFVLPFLLALFGAEGVTRVILFNAGFNPLLLLGVYGIAASYNPKTKRRRDVLRRILIMPPLWALCVGLLLNVSGTSIPGSLESILRTVGNLTMPLTIVALGLLFNPQRLRFDKTLAILGLRMGLGFVVGVAVVLALGLDGVDRAAVLALAAAPVGFNLLAFASIEKLDHELAANAVSLSLLMALVVTPLILLLAG